MRLNVYVDAFNLYYGCLRGSPHKWLDLLALSKRLFPTDDINRIRYFTAIVSARPHDLQQPQRQLTYIRALETIPCLTVHRGHYLTHNRWMPLTNPQPGGPPKVQVIHTEEKGSDVNLATYLLWDAFQGDFEAAAVLSNDSDLKEPIRLIEAELTLQVGVVNPHPPARRSRALGGAFFKQIRPAALKACQFPAVMSDANGQFTKPATW